MIESNSLEIQSALSAIKELLQAHFDEAEDSAGEDGKFSIGLRVSFDRSHCPTRLKVTCRVSKITTDEIECPLDQAACQQAPP